MGWIERRFGVPKAADRSWLGCERNRPELGLPELIRGLPDMCMTIDDQIRHLVPTKLLSARTVTSLHAKPVYPSVLHDRPPNHPPNVESIRAR